jgi:nitroreductase
MTRTTDPQQNWILQPVPDLLYTRLLNNSSEAGMAKQRLPLALFSLFLFASGYAQETIKLPAPRTEGGMPLMQALNERRSGREFSSEKLPLPVLSNLLWAAWGINRPDGHHTAPSASNRQEIDLYVALSEGLYLYEPKEHQLRRVLAEDVRAATGTQDFVKEAPVNLVYVADLVKANRKEPADIEFYSGTNTSFLAQNVYLFCASEKLETVVRASIDRPTLAKIMHLRPDQKITLAQSVGFPKNRK